jgi:Family of unknown function (DUF5985)
MVPRAGAFSARPGITVHSLRMTFSQRPDNFFLLFAVAFGLDAETRLLLGLTQVSDEAEPFFYLGRLVTFGLIIAAIIQKNRPGGEPYGGAWPRQPPDLAGDPTPAAPPEAIVSQALAGHRERCRNPSKYGLLLRVYTDGATVPIDGQRSWRLLYPPPDGEEPRLQRSPRRHGPVVIPPRFCG